MGGQRHDPEIAENRADQGRHQQIADGRRQAHAENDRRHHGECERQEEPAARGGLDHSLSWVADAYRVDEGSTSPQGLPNRWLVKAVIPLAFALMFLAAVARLLRAGIALFRPEEAA